MVNLNKFRFRIGDTIEYKGKPYQVMAYYFSRKINDFNNSYGYTINYPCHTGSSCSFNEKGESVSFESRTVMYVNKKEVNPIKEEKNKTKTKNIMTKEEAIKFLSNTKVYVGGKSKEIQEKLFELGFSWIEGDAVRYLEYPFLYIQEYNEITCGRDMKHFNELSSLEIKADDILSIEIDKEEPQFKPFDKVLVRDKEDEQWRVGFFSHISTEADVFYPFITTSSCFKRCIPYEGNEHLVGTTKSPKS